MKLKNSKLAQSLPMNTIVIAILVIIVLLVIVVFFTTKMGESGNSLDETTDGFKDCKRGNYAIPADKYSSASPKTPDECETANGVQIYGISVEGEKICCAFPLN